MRQEQSIHVARPPDEVFAYADAPENAPKWAEGIVRFDITDEKPGRVGTRYVMVIREGGRDAEYDGETLAYEPGRYRKEVARRGKMEMFMELRAEPEDGGTRLTQGVEVPLRGMMLLFTPVMGVMLRRSSRKQLAKLKELLESPQRS